MKYILTTIVTTADGEKSEEKEEIRLHELLAYTRYSSSMPVLKLRPGNRTFCFFKSGFRYSGANIRCVDNLDIC